MSTTDRENRKSSQMEVSEGLILQCGWDVLTSGV